MGTPTIPVRPNVVVASGFGKGRLGKEMIGVDKIDDIRRLGRGGASVASIARGTVKILAHFPTAP